MKVVELNETSDYAKSIEYSIYSRWSDTGHVESLDVRIDRDRLVPGEISAKRIDSETGEIRVAVHVFKPKFLGVFSSKAKLFSIYPDGRINE